MLEDIAIRALWHLLCSEIHGCEVILKHDAFNLAYFQLAVGDLVFLSCFFPVLQVERVSHRDTLQSFVVKSENLEKQCLAEAIKSYYELHVLQYELKKTVVFWAPFIFCLILLWIGVFVFFFLTEQVIDDSLFNISQQSLPSFVWSCITYSWLISRTSILELWQQLFIEYLLVRGSSRQVLLHRLR